MSNGGESGCWPCRSVEGVEIFGADHSNTNSDDFRRVGSPFSSRSCSENASAAGTTRSTPAATSDSTAPFFSDRQSTASSDFSSIEADAAIDAAATMKKKPMRILRNRSKDEYLDVPHSVL